MPKRSGKRKSSGKKSKNVCSRCGKTGHNKNNKKFHSLSNKESPDKRERCIMDIKSKQSKWCADRGYPMNTRDPNGKKCGNPFRICAKFR